MSTTITGLTRAPAGGAGKLHQEGQPGGNNPDKPPVDRPPSPAGRKPRRGWPRARQYLLLMAMMFPSLAGLALFTYYPQFNAIKYSLYEWDGQATEQYIGFANYVEAFFGDPLFWQTFQLVLILLGANLLKMWPSIFAAITLHRLRSERFQYIYRVLFVVPMIIPGIVSLLVWKSFFDAGTGALNIFLNKTGLMHLLDIADHTLATLTATGFATFVRDDFVIRFNVGSSPFHLHGLWALLLLSVGIIFAVMLTKRFRRGSAIGHAATAQTNSPDRLAKRDRRAVALRLFTWSAVTFAVGVVAIALLTCVWPTRPTRAFEFGTPGWLGNQNLIIPSIILWGFPWVGTVGVLIYLAGLQNITADVYEAAELDGVGSIRKLFAIELPLIMTQVRINLIFLTIGTITDYGLFLLLLGPTGGPGSRGMVPGLYMYNIGFNEQRFGYACALGMILFAILLVITIFYQKYVKVDK